MSGLHVLDGVVLEVGAATDPGLRRELNEDSMLAEPPVYLVADGMGGYESGDRASRAVVDAFRTVFEGRVRADLDGIRDALDDADAGVAAVAGGTQRGAGSTVAGAALVWLDELPQWVIFNVGDSRVYRQQGDTLQQVTVDHSLGQELFLAGRITAEELANFPRRNVITRAIGAPDADADSWVMPVVNGERLLLCSDGLHGEVDDQGIIELLVAHPDPTEAARELVEAAKRGGGKDNITVVVVGVVEGGLLEAPEPAEVDEDTVDA
ncbi:PP2C family protein-serine/threonine phosphatase [Protaetiibacter intestinalis]|uniref:Serine/threonine-protein phosphatase n=1 Tax=Protaetiibacter intestinalis TaxID=2419774 RepID=A0A387B5Y7_9MICO|nr:protein phosphatase 2C domain-containing protein [Protaetiibacter intestinalis]AYF97737.1 serine/threonine-protein phosphatase [Protaetiibacter intestinalis]